MTPEDSPLQVVGVLELVNQRAVKALAQDFGESRAAAAVQRAPYPGQHIVVIDQAPLTLVALQALHHGRQEKIDQFPLLGPDGDIDFGYAAGKLRSGGRKPVARILLVLGWPQNRFDQCVEIKCFAKRFQQPFAIATDAANHLAQIVEKRQSFAQRRRTCFQPNALIRLVQRRGAGLIACDQVRAGPFPRPVIGGIQVASPIRVEQQRLQLIRGAISWAGPGRPPTIPPVVRACHG